ncbi:phosphomannose isomerase type II C-terminal cupin domain [Acidobacteriota bacterium]
MPKNKLNSKEKQFRERILEDHRPWGKFRSFPLGNASSIKILTVNPNGFLSLQYHNLRGEFWIVLDEGLEITIGDQVWKPRKNEEIFIPQKTPHRVRNLGKHPARIMEIWEGKSDESDIVRIKDEYGRS